MVNITVNDDEVEVDVLGIHKLWALKNRLRFKRSSIKRIGLADKSLRPPLLKIPGTYLPGFFAAGTYRGAHRVEFWDALFSKEAVEIELTGEKYTRIVVNVREPREVVNLLGGRS